MTACGMGFPTGHVDMHMGGGGGVWDGAGAADGKRRVDKLCWSFILKSLEVVTVTLWIAT